MNRNLWPAVLCLLLLCTGWVWATGPLGTVGRGGADPQSSLDFAEEPQLLLELPDSSLQARIELTAMPELQRLTVRTLHDRHLPTGAKQLLLHLGFDGDDPAGLETGISTAPGKVGRALQLDGGDDGVLVNELGRQLTGGSFSVAAWILAEDGDDDDEQLIISCEGKEGSGCLSLGATGGELFFTVSGMDGQQFRATAGELVARTWVHLVGVWDAIGRELRLYRDGQLAARVPGPELPAPCLAPLGIGAKTARARPWHGLVDEVLVFARVLSGNEVASQAVQANESFVYFDDSLSTFLSLDQLAAQGSGQATVTDLSPAKHTCRVSGTTVGPGKVGNAVHLDGENDVILVEDSAEHGFTGSFSIEAWVRSELDPLEPEQAMIVAKMAPAQESGLMLGTVASGHLCFSVAGTSGDEYGWFGVCGDVPPTDTWLHVVAVYERPRPALSLYVDGHLAAVAAGPKEVEVSPQPVSIGAAADGSYGWQGAIDEVRIYQRELSAREVLFHALSSLSRNDNGGWQGELAAPVTASGSYRLEVDALDSHAVSWTLVSQPIAVAMPRPAFTALVLGDPHVQSDLYRPQQPALSLQEAMQDSIGGGHQGGEPIDWDIIIITGDYAGEQTCPDLSTGEEVMAQIEHAGVDPNRIYGVIGNHDADPDYRFFQTWIDPLGHHTESSQVNNAFRPYPVAGTWDHYRFRVGNLIFLMLGDRNAPGEPFGRDCSDPTSGYPAGAVSTETFLWWKDQVERYAGHDIITVAHHGLLETTLGTGFGEGFGLGLHGASTWADERASSMLYAIGDWGVDGFHKDGYYWGERPFGFLQLLAESPGLITLWMHGHTHSHLSPGIRYAGKSLVETRHRVTFVNAGAINRFHGPTEVPFSRAIMLFEGLDRMLIRTYLHEAGWRGIGEGFYDYATHVVQLKQPFSLEADLPTW